MNRFRTFAVLVAVSLGAIACAPPAQPSPSTGAARSPQHPPPATTEAPTPPNAPAIAFPVSGVELGVSGRGDDLAVAPRLDGGAYLALTGPAGPILASIDANGVPVPGWPLLISGPAFCDPPLVAPDGSLRIVCTHEGATPPNVAYAFDEHGQALAGWPLRFDGDLQLWERADVARMVGEELVVAVTRFRPPADPGDGPDTVDAAILGIDPAGSMTAGISIAYPCCGVPRLAPDGSAYLTLTAGDGPAARTAVASFDRDGMRAGWPIELAGWASAPAFRPDGRAVLAVGSPDAEPTRLALVDLADGAVDSGSPELPIPATSEWLGAGAEPGMPVVAEDGTAYVVATGSDATIYAVDPGGRVLDGWPYQSPVPLQELGRCSPEDTGCGFFRSVPAAGPEASLLVLFAATDGRGATVAAIERGGALRDGWPVEFEGDEVPQAISVGPDGTVYVPTLVEAQAARLVALAPDGSIRYRVEVARR
ncbi:MAG TPA: hypothetical protein VLA44_09225 [Clostridia bacterium]|nr:hypothetical protein [Clostridia bacterium]